MRIRVPLPAGLGVSGRVRHAVASVIGVPAGDLRRTTHLACGLGMDSLDVLEAKLEMEEEFGIDIPDAEVGALETVGAWEDYVAARMREAA